MVRVRLGESLLRHSHEQKTRPEGRGRWVLVSGTRTLALLCKRRQVCGVEHGDRL